MRNYETGLEYANTDPSLHFNTVERKSTRWYGAWFYCLKVRDEESAHLIRLRNDPKYAEEREAQEAAASVNHEERRAA